MDNGEIAPGRTHAYHLIPAEVSKARAVAAHMRARGYAREECIAVGDSREDLEVAEVVGRLFLVANAVAGDASAFANVERTEAPMARASTRQLFAHWPKARNRSYNLGVSGSSRDRW